MRTAIRIVLVLLLVVGRQMRAETIPGLGTATFPTSTKVSAAQQQFLQGLLLLHVFEYDDAAKAFQAAEKLDPDFAMAYWGEAMTCNHPVWNQVDPAAGRAVLAKFAPTPEARAARITDVRERDFMNAVEILYRDQGTKRQHDVDYATALEKMAAKYPKDDEVQLFYSLALLGRNEGVRDVPTYLKAAGIAKAAFERNPQHPGAAHYWIHGMDDPEHAAGALVAARALSKIAPDAGHAQHMCSHIFMALGMWDDVIAANQNGIRVVDEHSRAEKRPPVDCGHYAIWLEYAFYQEGRRKEGDDVVAACERTGKAAAEWAKSQPGDAAAQEKKAASMLARMNDSLVEMRGISVVETRDWTGPAATALGSDARSDDGLKAFAIGYAAAQRGDRGTAESSLDALQKAAKAGGDEAQTLGVMAEMLHGLMLSKDGKGAEGIAEVRKAADEYAAMAFDFGPPVTVKPPHELLGEMLLEQKKPTEAKAAFAMALKFAPKRRQSVEGLAKAGEITSH
jgi:tetratricopeptide (TPR) repeat protein